MIKTLTLALTITAVALGTTFAGDCPMCKDGKKDGKPAPTATPAKP